MQMILQWGVSVIAAIQTLRTPLLDHFFIAMSAIGSEYFYFAALPLICTVINRKIGIRITLTVLASVMLNAFLKTWISEPRPFILDPSVGVISETGYSFPSGHTQQAALFWGLVILYMRQGWVTVIGILLVGLIGLSRVYLGVHYPTDVLGALVIAALFLYFHQLLVKHEQSLCAPSRRYVVFGVVLFVAALASYSVPVNEMISAAGLESGLVGGLIFVPWPLAELASSWRDRVAMAVMTVLAFVLTYIGLGLILPGIESAYYEVYSFLRYFLCGFIFIVLQLVLKCRCTN